MAEATAGLARLIEPGAEMRRLGDGYQFTEGPVWIAARGCLEFVDIPSDTRWRWTEAGGMEVAEQPMFKASGLALDVDGHLIACEGGSSCVTRIRDGIRTVVAFHFEGTYLNSPNDLCVRSDGSIYFTDPDYGRWNDWIGQERTRHLGYRAVFRIPPGDGPLQRVVAEDEFDQPNGICLSPDETRLYINDSGRCQVKVFDVEPDGSLRGGRLFHDGIGSGVPREGNVDGMECDELGNVWITGPNGVWVLDPDGEHIGTVETPEVCGSLAWGGEDMHDLFLMTTTSVHVVRTIVGPALLPPDRP